MKFSIGDIVLLKRTGEEGRVAGVINKDMIEVEVGGTHFPVFLDEVDHPYLKWFTEQRKAKPASPRRIEDLPVEKPQTQKGLSHGVASGFHLSFLPVFRFDEFEDVVDKLKTYFINQTAYHITLHYECLGHQGSLFSHKTTLQPFAHFYLHDIPFIEMHEQPRFSWIIEQNNVLVPSQPLKDTLRIKPKKLFGFINKIQQDNHPMFHVKLHDDFPFNVNFEEKKEVSKSKETVHKIVEEIKLTKKPKFRQEVDLHIDKLVDTTHGMSNFEMLSIQLHAFEGALEEAIGNNQLSLIVIHGVGKGKLKDEIHALLKSVPEVEFFQSDWNPKYGYGATEIFFRQ
jgi:hypothetical protein